MTPFDELQPMMVDEGNEDDGDDNSNENILFTGDYFGDQYDAQDFGWDSEEGLQVEGIDTDLGWEPPCSPSPSGSGPAQEKSRGTASDESHVANTNPTERLRVEEALQQPIQRVLFPIASAAKPIEERCSDAAALAGYRLYETQLHPETVTDINNQKNIYAPFASKLDWQTARWAKLRGPGSTAFTDLLSIDGVPNRLGLSYKNSKELNTLVDSLPAQRPKFQREEIVVAGEAYDVYFQDVVECVQALYRDPEFASHLVFLPERHYADPDHTMRLYHDMYAGKWWWAVQKSIEESTPGATIMPIIISSDKTQVTLFCNKAAYPVYITISNLPKDIRSKPSQRGQILLGYLPTTKLEHISNKAARRRTLANLFHACMSAILLPLRRLGVEGMEMASGDGVVRRVHPIFAAYVGDYPEQVLVTGVKTADLDSDGEDPPLQDISQTLAVLATADESPVEFMRACANAGIKPIYEPFWRHLPYADIYLSITPDVLHQLYQGVVKHLVSWIKAAYDPAELNARCRRMPPNHNSIFGLRAVRALMDFVYLAQYPIHSDESLAAMEDALQRFHDDKDTFIVLGIRMDFNLPKLHFLRHYLLFIYRFGTTDNFNTEYTERLHIDFAKEAYRASNRKNEYLQMTLWLERKEKVLRHERYI
ncbi:hypothetical protein EW026_g6702 [Hermanssonia centrifuga]|uniref:Uncharacterized protein n=1 Tax=Hermanssonia centrifuga TaxID=98765 RepID=A0A4S4KA56_9APHY|nr:hypothetical protein EW026_g6702 [Hermanssonia centrifuga]